MNKKFLNAVIEIMSTYDEAMNAEIFNIFASNRDNIDFGLIKNGVYVFNMMDNSQAAQAVKKFGFDVVKKAVEQNHDWMLYAEKDNNRQWKFSSKSPSKCFAEYAEKIVYDILNRPKDFPSWAWEAVAAPLNELLWSE